jgi:hypothetical protein
MSPVGGRAALTGVVVLSLLELLSWSFEGGGILSIVSAAWAVAAQALAVDVDCGGFRSSS